jgi:hypothetical protein
MNRSSFNRFALAALLAAGAMPLSALRTTQAQPPSASQPFTTRIYIQNPNPSAANGIVNFYDEGTGNQQSVNVPFNLSTNGSTEILIGSLSGLGSPWQGSAVISADQPVVAASIQVPPSGYGHIMANAFTSGEASDSIFLTTFLAIGNPTNAVSLFGVQNTEAENVNIRARFINPTGVTVADVTLTLPAYTSKFFDGFSPTSTIANGLHAFNGSVVVTATKVLGGGPAKLVGIAEERRVEPTGPARFRAYGFEAIPQSAGAQTIYMPTALCKSGLGDPTTFFAIQNLSFTNSTVVTVTYATGTGTTPTPATNTLSPLAKWSIDPCQTNNNQTYSGAATITSSSQPIAAVGKASQTDPNLPARYTTAFLAQASGASRLAVPYIRWSPPPPVADFRSFIAIQNIGSALIPAGQLTVTYYTQNGSVAANCTSIAPMAVGAKLNSNAAGAFFTTDFNCSPAVDVSSTFIGSAVIQGPSGSSLIAVVRNTTPAATIQTEDFNAILLP